MENEQSKKLESVIRKFINDENVISIVELCMAYDILQGQRVMVEVFNSINDITVEENHERLEKLFSKMCINEKNLKVIEQQLHGNLSNLNPKKLFEKRIMMEIGKRLRRRLISEEFIRLPI